MDTIKIMVAVMKILGRSNPMFEYRIRGGTINILAYDLNGTPVGSMLVVNGNSESEVCEQIKSWIDHRFTV